MTERKKAQRNLGDGSLLWVAWAEDLVSRQADRNVCAEAGHSGGVSNTKPWEAEAGGHDLDDSLGFCLALHPVAVVKL